MGFHNSSWLMLLVLVALNVMAEQPSKGDHDQKIKDNFSLVRCNYSSVGFRSCSSCETALLCTHFNVGVSARCQGNAPHCNEGYCSETPTESCNSTSSDQRRRPISVTFTYGK